jgi:signal transduction histidine kinase
MRIRASEKAVSTLANLLEVNCITIAGYRQGGGVEGRLVLARERKRFADGDAAFLAQCAQTLAATVENITLTEELVARAAEVERLSISRDLHDTTIQPYIGLRMAIEGVAREFRDSPRVAERLAHLVEMTELGIEELRDYTMRLKSGGGAGTSFLGAAIERQARRVSRFYGLDVDVQIDASLQLESGAADAVFRMVCEGLSNVVRHTAAKRARVTIRSEGNLTVVEIANPLPDGLPSPRPFVPRSIAERAEDLGGRIAVEVARNGHTVVTVSIPLGFQSP